MALDVYKDWLGIPEGPRPPDHYALLRLVQFEDDAEKVRKNYKKLNAHVRKYATGQYATQSQDLLNELAKAMLCLTDIEAKKEYDQSIGRVIDERNAETGRRPMLVILKDQDIIGPAQQQEVKNYCDKTGLSPRDTVVQMKYATQDQASRALAEELGRPFIDLTELIPNDDVMDQLPRSVVRRHTCLPLFLNEDSVLVACADEPSHELEDEIRLRFGLPIRPVIATPPALQEAISKFYAAGVRKESSETKTPTKVSKSGKVSAKAVQPMTEGELEERKKLGIILICWTLILLGNFDTFYMWDKVYKFYLPVFFSWFPLVLTLLIGGPIIAIIYATMVGRKN